MAEIPNLAGVVTKDLVETIGSGNFKASYVNWSRTLQLLRTHAPGWMPATVPAEDGSLIHKAPVGGYLLIQFVHVDGTTTPSVPQSIMDHRNNAIPFEKITARDVTDTQRRGTCLAASFFFGLAYELWAKIEIESGYAPREGEASIDLQQSTPKMTVKAKKASGAATKETFVAKAEEKGLCKEAIDKLVKLVNGNFDQGLAALADPAKNAKWVEEQNAPFAKAASAEAW